MLLLELFCGTKSVSKVAKKKGIKCITLDIEKKFNPDICIDILEWDYKKSNLKPDIIWASPPCNSWSLAAHGLHRNNRNDLKPKSKTAELGDKTILRLIEIIKYFNPKYYFIENPRGYLKFYKPMEQFPRRLIYYGDYGLEIKKATNIWTNCEKWKPTILNLKKKINIHKHYRNPIKRSIVPEKLCEEIIDSVL